MTVSETGRAGAEPTPSSLRVFVSGQKQFGAMVAAMVNCRHRLVGIASPAENGRGGLDRLAAFSEACGAPWTDASALKPSDIPPGTDVIVAAHSHAFIGRLTRARAALAIGYHPSLLPLHRGRDAVRWTVRDGDKVTGGTVYHLTNKTDGGPVAAARHVLVPPGITAAALWRELLAPLGVTLLGNVLSDVAAGESVGYTPQDEALATWEPSWERPPLFKPELMELPGPDTGVGVKFAAAPGGHRATW